MGADSPTQPTRTFTNGNPHRLKDHAENSIPDEIFEKRFERWPEETPDTKEAYYLRDIFDSEIAPSTPFC
jgi:hypothetical protein